MGSPLELCSFLVEQCRNSNWNFAVGQRQHIEQNAPRLVRAYRTECTTLAPALCAAQYWQCRHQACASVSNRMHCVQCQHIGQNAPRSALAYRTECAALALALCSVFIRPAPAYRTECTASSAGMSNRMCRVGACIVRSAQY